MRPDPATASTLRPRSDSAWLESSRGGARQILTVTFSDRAAEELRAADHRRAVSNAALTRWEPGRSNGVHGSVRFKVSCARLLERITRTSWARRRELRGARETGQRLFEQELVARLAQRRHRPVRPPDFVRALSVDDLDDLAAIGVCVSCLKLKGRGASTRNGFRARARAARPETGRPAGAERFRWPRPRALPSSKPSKFCSSS